MTQSTSSVRRFWAKKSGSSGSLYLYGDVGGWWGGINAKQITDTLKDLALNGVDELSCYVNSYGGDVFEGFAIYNALKRFDGDVTMYVDGIAASAASLICMAGKSICMSSASMMMIHEASVFNGGTAEDHEAAAAMLAKINESLISVYAARSGESESSVKQMLADETWLTAKEAKSKGFCDQILKDDDDASAEARFTQRAFASASPLLEKYRHVPQSVLARIPAAGPASKVAQRDRNEPKKSKERHMSKKNKASAFTLYKLGLPPDASDADVMEALDNLQERARGADVARAKIEAEARAKAEADVKAKREKEGELDLATLGGKAAVEAQTSDKSRADSERQLIELTGKKTYGEALGVVAAWKALPAEIEKLQQELATLKVQGQGATAEMLVEQGVRDGKISPAQKELWLSIGKKNPEMLKGFLDTASTVVPKKSATSPETKAKVALTAEQIKAAAKMGITKPEDLDKLSVQLAETQALRAGGV